MSNDIRILGLTASLTYAVSEGKVISAAKRLCNELRIQHMATAGPEELQAAGYHATKATAEVRPAQIPDAATSGVLPEAERKPHLMVPSFKGCVARGSATPFALRLMTCIGAMEAAVSWACRNRSPPKKRTATDAAAISFSSPIDRSLPVSEWGKEAKKMAPSLPDPSWAVDLEHWY